MKGEIHKILIFNKRCFPELTLSYFKFHEQLCIYPYFLHQIPGVIRLHRRPIKISFDNNSLLLFL